MQELEKILEEIDQEVKEYMEIDFGDEYNAGIKDMAKMAKKIIRKYMNDGWISVDERMPTQEECKDNLFWITYGYFSSSSRVAQCQWVLSYDENGNDDSYSEFYIDQAPSIYVPSQNLVTAWKIIDIPEPYRLERSERK